MGLFSFFSTAQNKRVDTLNTCADIIFDNGFKDVTSKTQFNMQTINLHAQYYFECQIIALTLIALHYQRQCNISIGLDYILKESNPLRKICIDLAKIGAKTSTIVSNCKKNSTASSYDDVHYVLTYILYERYCHYETDLSLLLYKDKSEFDNEFQYEEVYKFAITDLYNLSHNPYVSQLNCPYIKLSSIDIADMPHIYIDMLQTCKTARQIIEKTLK